jgi:hypothetical protein
VTSPSTPRLWRCAVLRTVAEHLGGTAVTPAHRGRLRISVVFAMAALMLTACGVPLQESPEPLQSDVLPAALASESGAPD